MRKIKNTRIFTWKTLCPTKVKNHHDLPPVGFSLSTITGKHGYNVTHPITSNSHSNVQHLWTLPHVLVSPRPGQFTQSQKNEFASLLQTLLSQANCKDNQSSNIFAKTLNNSITLTKNQVFLSLKAHNIFQTQNLNFFFWIVSLLKQNFPFLNNFG